METEAPKLKCGVTSIVCNKRKIRPSLKRTNKDNRLQIELTDHLLTEA
jgi:hypothetical protein